MPVVVVLGRSKVILNLWISNIREAMIKLTTNSILSCTSTQFLDTLEFHAEFPLFSFISKSTHACVQISNIHCFRSSINNFKKDVTILYGYFYFQFLKTFAKSSTFDVWQDSKYDSDNSTAADTTESQSLRQGGH